MTSRRDFLKGGLSALGLGLLGGVGLGPGRQAHGQVAASWGGAAASPLLQLPPNPASVMIDGFPFAPWFTGDDFPDPQSIPFHIAWQGTVPTPSEDVDVAVVGGGISGLASAYLLRQHRPVVLELRPRFGGNALGERWRGTYFSLGSAYVITPDAGSFLEDFYQQLRLDHVKSEVFPPDPVELYGQIQPGFWDGVGMSPQEQQAFSLYAGVVTDMADNAYPEIPLSSDPLEAAVVRQLDESTFRQHLERRMGVPLTPLLAAGIQGYFYSSFGAGIDAISAASGWNFVAAEEYGRWVFPGGNAWLARALWRKLRRVQQQGHGSAAPMLRADCRVVDVRRVADRVHVTWLDSSGQAHALRAKYVVMAGSKHVCKYVLHALENLDQDKYEAMQHISTAAYVVANVLLDVPAPTSGYDLFLLGGKTFPMTEVAAEQDTRPIDVVDGNYALHPNHPRSVLTLYWPLPWPTARFSLLLNNPHELYAQTLVPHLVQALGVLNVPTTAVKQVRLSRWGHAMPVATPNLISSGIPERLLRPFQDRVFFVNQDNWALPAVENSLLDAQSVTDQIKALL